MGWESVTGAAVARRRRHVAVGTVLLFAVLLAAVVIVLVAGSRASDPHELVTRYLDAVASGDAETANDLAASASDEDDTTFEALAGAAFAGGSTIADAEVVEIHELVETEAAGDRRSATVTFSVGGEGVERDITLVRDGTQWLFFPVWRIERPLVESVRVESLVAGFDFAVGDVGATYDSDGVTRVALYPGEYRVTRAGSDLLEAEEQTITVTGEGSVIRFEDAAAPALVDGLRADAASDLDRCTEPRTSYNDECGVFPDAVAYIRNPVTWTVEQTPEVELEPGDGRAAVSASLRAEYEGRDLQDEPFTTMSEVVDVRGVMRIWFDSLDEYEFEVEWGRVR